MRNLLEDIKNFSKFSLVPVAPPKLVRQRATYHYNPASRSRASKMIRGITWCSLPPPKRFSDVKISSVVKLNM